VIPIQKADFNHEEHEGHEGFVKVFLHELHALHGFTNHSDVWFTTE
jgi:hypothetical protein